MTKIRFTLMAGALLLAAPALAEDAHHPAEVAPEAPSQSAPAPAPQQAAPGGMMVPGMMSGDMMQMMMRMMMSGGQSPMAGEEMGRMASSGPMGPMAQMMSPEHVEGRIAFLRTELKVTPAQEPLWEAVAEALRESARASEHMMQQRATAQTLLSALDGRERALSARLESVRRLRASVEPFYAALDEAQKATADKLMEPLGTM